MSLKQLSALKQKVDDLSQKQQREQGILDQLKRDLRKEFDCRKISEAKRLLRNLLKERDAAKEEFKELHSKFEEEFGDKFR